MSDDFFAPAPAVDAPAKYTVNPRLGTPAPFLSLPWRPPSALRCSARLVYISRGGWKCSQRACSCALAAPPSSLPPPPPPPPLLSRAAEFLALLTSPPP
eukprot:COSAG01_NODE_2334_length_7882_cov_105.499807_1_plen_98_part_10